MDKWWNRRSFGYHARQRRNPSANWIIRLASRLKNERSRISIRSTVQFLFFLFFSSFPACCRIRYYFDSFIWLVFSLLRRNFGSFRSIHSGFYWLFVWEGKAGWIWTLIKIFWEVKIGNFRFVGVSISRKVCIGYYWHFGNWSMSLFCLSRDGAMIDSLRSTRLVISRNINIDFINELNGGTFIEYRGRINLFMR